MDKQEEWARKQHEWYLEATAKLHPESYNPNAQKSYDDLTEEQKFIDRYIAQKGLDLRSKDRDTLIEKIGVAFGEVSALFMSQEVKGTEIIMPTEELERIAETLAEEILSNK